MLLEATQVFLSNDILFRPTTLAKQSAWVWQTNRQTEGQTTTLSQ